MKIVITPQEFALCLLNGIQSTYPELRGKKFDVTLIDTNGSDISNYALLDHVDIDIKE